MASTIDYTVSGEGEAIVLIHGIGHRREAWASVPQRLVDAGHQVVAIDLPGHGLSPKPAKPHGYSMASSAEQLEEFFDAVGLDKPHVVGNSLGGQMVLELAARGSVASATAVSPAGFYSPLELAVVAPNLLLMKLGAHAPTKLSRKFTDNERLRRIAMRALYVHPERLSAEDAFADTQNLRNSKGFWPHFVRATLLHYRARPVVPTTVAWGDRDRLLLPRQAKRAAERMPEATHVSLPNCGHCPMIDDPELLVDVIVETVKRANEQRRAAGDETLGDDVDAGVPAAGSVEV